MSKELLERLIRQCFPLSTIDMIFKYEENVYYALTTNEHGRHKILHCIVKGDYVNICNEQNEILFTRCPNEYHIILHRFREYFRKDLYEALKMAELWRGQVWQNGELVHDYSNLPF